MKFYFCEGCGKRVTEHDISDGAAKDKKLKGIYCRACSAGVSTMNSLPLTNAQADKLLAEEPPSRSTPRGGNRQSSQRMRSTAKGSSGAKVTQRVPRHTAKAPPEDLNNSKTSMLLGGVGIVCVVIFGIIFSMDGPSEDTRVSKVKQSKVEQRNVAVAEEPSPLPTESEPKPTPLTQPVVKSVAPEIVPEVPVEGPAEIPLEHVEPPELKPVAIEPSREALALAAAKEAHAKGAYGTAWDALLALGSASDADAERKEDWERIEAFKAELLIQVRAEIQKLDESTQGMGLDEGIKIVTLMSDRCGVQLAKTVKLDVLLGGLVKKKADAQKVAELKQAGDARLRGIIESFEGALRENRIDAAKALAVAAAEKAESDYEAEQMQALAAIVSTIEETKRVGQKVREATLKKWVGMKITVQTVNGPRTGVLLRFADNVLYFKTQYIINGKKLDGPPFQIKISELASKLKERWWPQLQPKSANERMAVVVSRFVANDMSGTKKALADVKAHPLRDFYVSWFAGLKNEMVESSAARDWEQNVVPLMATVVRADETNVSKDSKVAAKSGLKAIKLFRASHGKTIFAKGIDGEARKFEMQCNVLLGPARDLVLPLGNGITMPFVLIQPGTFMMGDKTRKKNEAYVKPVQVTITKGFYLSIYEVTLEQYVQILGKPKFKQVGRGPKCPVTSVNWNMAKRYCNALASKTKRNVRLPTEAEWEYACRAGTQTMFNFGDDPKLITDYAWVRSNTEDAPRPVGKKKPNAWGLFDMHGNVNEWCSDFRGPKLTKDAVDPTGPAAGKGHVYRGGNFRTTYSTCRSATRGFDSSTHRDPSRGMRIALDY